VTKLRPGIVKILRWLSPSWKIFSVCSCDQTATWNSENDLDGLALHGKYSLYALVTKLRPGIVNWLGWLSPSLEILSVCSCDQTATWNSENDLDGLAPHGKYSLYALVTKLRPGIVKILGWLSPSWKIFSVCSCDQTATWNSENDLDGLALHGKYSLYALVTKLRPGIVKMTWMA